MAQRGSGARCTFVYKRILLLPPKSARVAVFNSLNSCTMGSKNKLPYRVETRVDEAKYMELNSLLSKSGCQTMSELLRDILYKGKVKIITYDNSLDKVMEVLSGIRSEINAIGVNINQVTRYFNSDPNPRQKVIYASKVADQYQTVGVKVDQLLIIIAKLAEKWLPK